MDRRVIYKYYSICCFAPKRRSGRRPGRSRVGGRHRHRPDGRRGGTLGRGTRRAATSTDYGGAVARRRREKTTGESWSRRAGRDEGGSRKALRRSAGGCTKRSGAAGRGRGTMWKTASASPPSERTPPVSLGGSQPPVATHSTCTMTMAVEVCCLRASRT